MATYAQSNFEEIATAIGVERTGRRIGDVGGRLMVSIPG
jgi:hypothetical protein